MADPRDSEPTIKDDMKDGTAEIPSLAIIESMQEGGDEPERRSLSKRILGIIWDALDKSPEERKFVAKADAWILSYVSIAYCVKYLDQTNVSPYVRSLHMNNFAYQNI